MRKGHWEPIFDPPQWLVENSDGTLSRHSDVPHECWYVVHDIRELPQPRKRWVWDEPLRAHEGGL